MRRTLSSILAVALLASATAFAPQPAEAMRTELAPCNERSLGGRTVDGKVWHAMAIRTHAGKACRFNMTIGGNAAVLGVRVLKAPSRGTLVRVRRNEIVYRPGRGNREDQFALAFKVKNLNGTGWVNVAIKTVPH